MKLPCDKGDGRAGRIVCDWAGEFDVVGEEEEVEDSVEVDVVVMEDETLGRPAVEPDEEEDRFR